MTNVIFLISLIHFFAKDRNLIYETSDLGNSYFDSFDLKYFCLDNITPQNSNYFTNFNIIKQNENITNYRTVFSLFDNIRIEHSKNRYSKFVSRLSFINGLPITKAIRFKIVFDSQPDIEFIFSSNSLFYKKVNSSNIQFLCTWGLDFYYLNYIIDFNNDFLDYLIRTRNYNEGVTLDDILQENHTYYINQHIKNIFSIPEISSKYHILINLKPKLLFNRDVLNRPNFKIFDTLEKKIFKKCIELNYDIVYTDLNIIKKLEYPNENFTSFEDIAVKTESITNSLMITE